MTILKALRNIPIYDVELNNQDESTGIFAISLVNEPAVQSSWLAFSKNQKIMFSIENEEKHILTGVLMLADTPIYRVDEDGFEYYIRFSKSTIRKMAEKMFKNESQEMIDLEHDGEYLKKGDVQLIECFIKDINAGINPSAFSKIPDGSLFGTFKVNNDEVWKMVKDKTINGFSIFGQFNLNKSNDFVKLHKNNKKSNMSKIQSVLKKILQSFGETALKDGGSIIFDGENLEVGVEVVDTPDGEYTLEDGSVVKIEGGKVASINKATSEDEPTTSATENMEQEEATEPTTTTNDAEQSTLDKLIQDFVNLSGRVEALEKKVDDFITAPAAPPIVEEFKAAVENENPKDIKLQRMLKYAKALKH